MCIADKKTSSLISDGRICFFLSKQNCWRF